MPETITHPAVEATPLHLLKPAPWNPRKIKDERFQNLVKSIETDPEFLWRRPVLAMADGTIYAGNMRYRAAEHLGLKTIPAIREDIPEQLAKERALRDNAQWGEWVEEELASMLEELRVDGSAMDLFGFDERELQKLLNSLDRQGGLTDPDDIPELPEEPVTQPGDLYQLGPHRVLCGDSRGPGELRLVLDGELAACAWTDPPYGVEYTGGTKDRLTIRNDTAEGLDGLLSEAFAAMDECLQPGAAIYVAHPAGANSVVFHDRFVGQGWQLRQGLVWVKDRLVLGHSDYHYRHEPVLFGYKPGASGRRGRGGNGWFGANDCTSVFEVSAPRRNDEHPTSKPVALVEAMLKNSTKTGDLVLDPFLGSGSTLIACEQLQRKCYGIEVDPKYVDVIVARWERFTGKKAKRIEAGGRP